MYLRSEYWRKTRERYFSSALPQGCYVCGEEKVDLHHKTYKRLGREPLTDLLPLCREHHTACHKLVREKGNRSKWNNWTVAKLLKKKLEVEQRQLRRKKSGNVNGVQTSNQVQLSKRQVKRQRLTRENDLLHQAQTQSRARRAWNEDKRSWGA